MSPPGASRTASPHLHPLEIPFHRQDDEDDEVSSPLYDPFGLSAPAALDLSSAAGPPQSLLATRGVFSPSSVRTPLPGPSAAATTTMTATPSSPAIHGTSAGHPPPCEDDTHPRDRARVRQPRPSFSSYDAYAGGAGDSAIIRSPAADFLSSFSLRNSVPVSSPLSAFASTTTETDQVPPLSDDVRRAMLWDAVPDEQGTRSTQPDDEGQSVGDYMIGRPLGFGGFSVVKEAFWAGAEAEALEVDSRGRGWGERGSEAEPERGRGRSSRTAVAASENGPGSTGSAPVRSRSRERRHLRRTARLAVKVVYKTPLTPSQAELAPLTSSGYLPPRDLARRVEGSEVEAEEADREDALENELYIWSNLPPHPHILPLVEIIETDFAHWIVMKRCEGGNLLDFLRNHAREDDRARRRRSSSGANRSNVGRSASVNHGPTSAFSPILSSARRSASSTLSRSSALSVSSAGPSQGVERRGLDLGVAQRIFAKLVSALYFLHEEMGVVHRDVKLENILRDLEDEEATGGRVEGTGSSAASTAADSQEEPEDEAWRAGSWRLADFGLAEVIPSSPSEQQTARAYKVASSRARAWMPDLLMHDFHYAYHHPSRDRPGRHHRPLPSPSRHVWFGDGRLGLQNIQGGHTRAFASVEEAYPFLSLGSEPGAARGRSPGDMAKAQLAHGGFSELSERFTAVPALSPGAPSVSGRPPPSAFSPASAATLPQRGASLAPSSSRRIQPREDSRGSRRTRQRTSMSAMDAESPDVQGDTPAAIMPGGSLPYTAPELLRFRNLGPPRTSSPAGADKATSGGHAGASTTASIGNMADLSLSPAVDIWAAGCVLYALLSGKLPFMDSFEPRLMMKIVRAQWKMPDRLVEALTETGDPILDRWAGADEERAQAREVLRGMLEPEPERRWTIIDVVRSAWVRPLIEDYVPDEEDDQFASMFSCPVPVERTSRDRAGGRNRSVPPISAYTRLQRDRAEAYRAGLRCRDSSSQRAGDETHGQYFDDQSGRTSSSDASSSSGAEHSLSRLRGAAGRGRGVLRAPSGSASAASESLSPVFARSRSTDSTGRILLPGLPRYYCSPSDLTFESAGALRTRRSPSRGRRAAASPARGGGTGFSPFDIKGIYPPSQGTPTTALDYTQVHAQAEFGCGGDKEEEDVTGGARRSRARSKDALNRLRSPVDNGSKRSSVEARRYATDDLPEEEEEERCG